jgi:hypothetical protein
LIAIIVTLLPDQAAYIVLVDAQTATTFGTVAALSTSKLTVPILNILAETLSGSIFGSHWPICFNEEITFIFQSIYSKEG